MEAVILVSVLAMLLACLYSAQTGQLVIPLLGSQLLILTVFNPADGWTMQGGFVLLFFIFDMFVLLLIRIARRLSMLPLVTPIRMFLISFPFVVFLWRVSYSC